MKVLKSLHRHNRSNSQMKAGATPLDLAHKTSPTHVGAPSHLNVTKACIVKNLQLIKEPLGVQGVVQLWTHN
jgi:hypothetical protein